MIKTTSDFSYLSLRDIDNTIGNLNSKSLLLCIKELSSMLKKVKQQYKFVKFLESWEKCKLHVQKCFSSNQLMMNRIKSFLDQIEPTAYEIDTFGTSSPLSPSSHSTEFDTNISNQNFDEIDKGKATSFHSSDTSYISKYEVAFMLKEEGIEGNEWVIRYTYISNTNRKDGNDVGGNLKLSLSSNNTSDDDSSGNNNNNNNWSSISQEYSPVNGNSSGDDFHSEMQSEDAEDDNSNDEAFTIHFEIENLYCHRNQRIDLMKEDVNNLSQYIKSRITSLEIFFVIIKCILFYDVNHLNATALFNYEWSGRKYMNDIINSNSRDEIPNFLKSISENYFIKTTPSSEFSSLPRLRSSTSSLSLYSPTPSTPSSPSPTSSPLQISGSSDSIHSMYQALRSSASSDDIPISRLRLNTPTSSPSRQKRIASNGTTLLFDSTQKKSKDTVM